MVIFLTGATGYIGKVVTEYLQAKGLMLSALVRSTDQAAVLEEKRIRPIIGDLSDVELLQEEAEKSDGVIHLAISHSNENERLDTDAVQAMLKGLEGSSKPFVYTSGTIIYNDTRSETVDEETEVRPIPPLKWKAAQEKIVLDAEKRKIRSVVVRPTLVYGRGGGIVRRHIDLCKQLQSAKFIGDGSNAWSTIHVDDLASLFYQVLFSSKAGSLYNATSREQITMRELMTAIARSAGLEDNVGSISMDEALEIYGPNAWPFTINQRISGLKAEMELQWVTMSKSIIDEIIWGSYLTK